MMAALTLKPILIERALNGYVVQTSDGILVFTTYEILAAWLATQLSEPVKH